MYKNMSKNKKIQLLITIGALTFSPFVFSQEQNNNYVNPDDMNTDDIEIEENFDEGYNVESEESSENSSNPFMNLSSNLEQLNLSQREKESELSLVESEIELQRKQFEKEMLPYQMEIERAQVQEQLYDIQNRMQEPTPPPSISMNDIEDKIDVVAGEMLRKQEEQIEELEKEKKERIERENTFILKLISENSNDGVYSIISDGEGNDYRVTKGDHANDWEVIGIDKDRMRVVVRKDGETEVISPNNNNNLSIISMRRGSSNNNDDSEESNNEDMDDIPEPNFR